MNRTEGIAALLITLIVVPLVMMALASLALVGYGIYGIIAGIAVSDVVMALAFGGTFLLIAIAVAKLIFA